MSSQDSIQDFYQKPLGEEEFKILKSVTRDPFLFSQFCNVTHPTRGKILFDLYKYQKKVLYNFLKYQFNIILKFRQAGITELIAMYCLWLSMYHSNKNIIIISIKDTVAKRVLRKIKFMYKNLPWYLRVPVINGRGSNIGTSTVMEFSNGSMITSIPTTEDAGRSEGVSLLVIDEAAIVRWIGKIWESAFPTLSTGGSAIVNSTPYGVGNWYHSKWTEACSGNSRFNPIRLRWWMHPERGEEWYRRMSNELGPRKTAQEIDGDFLASGFNVFDLTEIKAIEDLLPEYPPIEIKYNGQLRYYKKAEKGKKFFIGADVSTGRARDYSSFSVMDIHGEEYASFRGKVTPGTLANILMEVGKEYNNALLAPESNDIGLSTTEKIQEAGYPHLYYSKSITKKRDRNRPVKSGERKEADVPGWYTTKQNRPVIIGDLEEDLRQDPNLIIKDPEFVREAYTFIYDNQNRPVAMGKDSSDEEDADEQVYTDDSIMGKTIANKIRKTTRPQIHILPG